MKLLAVGAALAFAHVAEAAQLQSSSRGWAEREAALMRRKNLRLRQQYAAPEDDLQAICSFKVFSTKEQEEATKKNLVFRTEGALVVQDDDSRVLVFLRKDENGTACHEEAEVKCGGTPPLHPYADLLQKHGQKDEPSDAAGDGGPAATATSALACSAAPPCHPSDMPGLSYIRSMIGGALMSHGGTTSRIASIGLGAGTIPLWFQRNMPGAEVDSVDLDPDVVQAAPCFGLTPSPKLHLIEADGRSYLMNQPDGAFDVIFLDAFDNRNYIPNCLKTVEFFRGLRSKLSPGGVLAVNSWRRELGVVYASMSAAFTMDRMQIGRSPGLGNDILLGQAPGAPEGGADVVQGITPMGRQEIMEWSGAAAFDTPAHALENFDLDPAEPSTDQQLCPSAR